MNYIAHLYLSKNYKDILIGNFIADSIRGTDFVSIPKTIKQGIVLHRQIDTYTDTHPIVKKSKSRLNKRYGHYRGVIIDIFYDHFLTKNWEDYSAIPLDIYINGVYKLLMKNVHILPTKTKELLFVMMQYNWLYHYQFIDGIQKVLIGMNKRTNGKSKMNVAIEDLQLYYHDFQQDFTIFFKELNTFTTQKLKELYNKNISNIF